MADEELRWFFSVEEGTLGSAFFDELLAQAHPEAPDGEAPGTQAYRRIRGWLLEMSDREAGVLKAAYTPGPWPPGLVEELGRLTGIVVRLASADVGWPEQQCDQEALEARVAVRLETARVRDGEEVFAPYRAKATELLRTAGASYLRERELASCARRRGR